jgi:hypothetical protein
MHAYGSIHLTQYLATKNDHNSDRLVPAKLYICAKRDSLWVMEGISIIICLVEMHAPFSIVCTPKHITQLAATMESKNLALKYSSLIACPKGLAWFSQ